VNLDTPITVDGAEQPTHRELIDFFFSMKWHPYEKLGEREAARYIMALEATFKGEER
jgi:hypothetical protein